MTKQTGFYAYVYYGGNNTPIYVGKGSSNRAQAHFKLCFHSRYISGKKKSRFYAYLRKHHQDTRVEIIAHGLTEFEAFVLEERLIEHYGRVEDGGSLLNHATRRVGGVSYTKTPEQKTAQSSRLKGRTITWGNKIAEAHRGRKRPQSTKDKMSISRTGDRNGSWKGVTPEMVKEARARGLTILQVAAALGISRSMVIRKSRA